MTSFNSGTQPQYRAPQSIGFLLLDNFTLISLASAVEPLRMANQLSGRELYRWTTLSVDGNQVWASDGLQITPDASMHKAPALDTVIVCGGVGIQRTVTREHVSWLQSQARQSRRLGAVCTGSWALACAGLLDGFDCSVHWECLASMQEAFPRVSMSTRLFTLDRNRFTSSGGTAPLDMMLHLINNFDLVDGIAVASAQPPTEDQTLWSTISNLHEKSFSVRMASDVTFRRIMLESVDFDGSQIRNVELPAAASFPEWKI